MAGVVFDQLECVFVQWNDDHVLHNTLNGGVWRVKNQHVNHLKQCVLCVFLFTTQCKYAYTPVVQLCDCLPHCCNKPFTTHIVVHLFLPYFIPRHSSYCGLQLHSNIL